MPRFDWNDEDRLTDNEIELLADAILTPRDLSHIEYNDGNDIAEGWAYLS